MSYKGRTEFYRVGLSVNQVANFAVGQHIEFDTVFGRGTAFPTPGVTVTTGAGQANGILTIQPGEWLIQQALRFASTIFDLTLNVIFHDGAVALLDIAGRQLLCTPAVSNNSSTQSPLPVIQSFFTFAAAQTAEVRINALVGAGAVAAIERNGSYLTLIRQAPPEVF